MDDGRNDQGPGRIVSLADDARMLSPAEMAARLARLTQGGSIAADYYGNGGAVAAFEARIARLLGKERAVMFPTGTLANLIAMRLLAGAAPARLIVHREGHFYNDSGDNLSALGGYTMVPLGGDGPGFGVGEVAAEIARAANARVASRIGCIAVESPSRRLDNRCFPQAAIDAIAGLARSHGIPMFLDGARMLIECAAFDRTPAAMAAPFDLVYVSLYKYLDAPFGCILAGSAARLDAVFHDRRRHGGGLYQMWPAAVLADAALDRQAGEWPQIFARGDEVLAALAGAPGLRVERFADGTNAVRIVCTGPLPEPETVSRRAETLRLKLPPPRGDGWTVKMNASWLDRAPALLAGQIAEALRPGGPG